MLDDAATRETPPEEIVRFSRIPPALDARTGILLGMAVGLFLSAPLVALPTTATAIVCGLGALLFVIALVLRRRQQRIGVPPIEAHATHLRLPRSVVSTKTDEVPYQDVLAIDVTAEGRRGTLILGTSRRAYGFPVKTFHDPAAALVLRGLVRARIAALPDADRLLAAMHSRESLGRLAWSRRPLLTQVLLAMVIAVFGLQHLTGALDGIRLVRLGANVPMLVEEGQWYRLLTANFLHGGFLHVYMNGISLFSLGALVERVLGPVRYGFIWAVSAIAGSMASAALSQGLVSVGASTALFGLLGALAAMQWRARGQLPSGFGQTRRWWIIILLLNGLLPVFVPQIDWAAHAGGFVAGALATLVVCRDGAQLRRDPRPGPSLTAVTALLGVLFVAAFAQAAQRYADPTTALDETRVLVAALAKLDDSAAAVDALNAMAWDVVQRPEATREELEVAQQAIEHAVVRSEGAKRMAVRDTQATVLFRLGKLDEAIDVERSLMGEPTSFFASQLARFLRARLDAVGPLVRGNDAPSAVPRAELMRDDAGARLVIQPRESSRGILYVLVESPGGELLGLLDARLDQGSGEELELDASTLPIELTSAVLRVAMLDVDGVRTDSDARAVRYWRMDPAAKAMQ